MSSTKTCPSCQIERDLESFSLTPEVTEHAICDFCVELGPKAPPPTPKKRGRKPKEAPQEPTPLPTPQPAQETPQKPPERPVERSPEIQAEADAAFAMPYVAPKFDQQAAATDPVRELAARELARRRLLPFIQRFRPKYMPGWVHKDICRRLERFVVDVEAGKEPRLLLMMPPRAGKQLADDTLVPTPAGWRRHGDLAPGDEVFHPSGRPVKVLAVSEKTPSNVKVTFSDGSSYFCHENHEWALYNRMRREWQTIETNHFLKPTRFGKAKQTIQGTRCMYQLPIAEPLRYNGTEFLTHPYVLGAWLGDGSAGKPCITGAKSDKAIIDRVVELGYPVSTVCEHQTTGVLTTYFSGDGVTDVGLVPKRRGPIPGRLSQELEVLGVFKDKHIPESYLRLKTELRLQLVAGLIDTDGHTDKNGRMSFTTASRKLADGVMELLSGLGFRPYIQEIEPRLSTSGIQGQKVYWCIGFQPTMPIPVVLPRKSVSRIAKQRRVGLVSVERVESGKQGHCIQVDSPDGLYVVGEKLTVTHNSEIGSRHFAPWVLGKHPEWEIIAASHTGSLSLSFSRYIRDLLRDPAYNSVFPDAVLDPSSQSVENWNLTRGGGYLAAGVGTGITGRGAHILILDDLVKDQEAADSPTIRENTWEWYISTAHSRLAPGGGVLGIMTWWSEDDWAGRIQEAMKGDGEKFEIVRYPAINEEGDEYILVDDRIVEIPPGSPVPEGARMTRPHGTALHPERYTTEALRRKKLNYKAAGMIRMWNALYQQNPTPDSGIYFTKDLFRRYAHAPSRRGRTIYQAWDFAITEGAQNDYTVCATILQDEFDNLYVIDIFRFKSDDGNAIVEHMIDQYVMWDVDYLGMEDGQIWKAIRSQFERRCQERKVYPSFEVLQPLTDKLVRANPLKGRMQLGKVYWPEDGAFPWVEPCVRELIVFPNGKHDDQVDACFVAGTPIAMADGSTKPIELVAQGDLVATPIGPRVVTHAWLSKRDADVVEAEFSNGALLRGTAAHPFATDRGWVGLSDLMPSDRLQGIASQQPGESSCQGFTRKQPPTSSDLSSTERFIAATLTRLEGTFGGISRALVAFYTGTFGSFTTALSLKAIKFITRMETISTTTFGTWSASLGQDTKSSILRSEARSEGLTPRFGISRRSARKRLTGTSPRKEGVGTQNMGRRPGKDEPQQPLCAGSVGLDLSLSGRTLHSVQKSVSGETGASATLVMTRRSVLEQRQDVFNISVDEAECYYAAGILVHNCAWAVRMTLNHSAPRDPAPKPKGPESWKTRLARELAGAGGGHMAS